MQCVLEINTGVCETVGEAERDLRGKIAIVEAACDALGLRLWWGATHPFSSWLDQRITPDDRYLQLVNLLQEMARRLVTFGLHVHVGVDSGDKAVMICDRIMRHLPTLLALSVSSPFWEGRKTGLHSHRSKVMEGLPTAGLPTLMRNWSEYVWLVNHMIDTGFINTIREIWWDVRPHHNFGTVEVRVCDMPGNLQDTLGAGGADPVPGEGAVGRDRQRHVSARQPPDDGAAEQMAGCEIWQSGAAGGYGYVPVGAGGADRRAFGRASAANGRRSCSARDYLEHCAHDGPQSERGAAAARSDGRDRGPTRSSAAIGGDRVAMTRPSASP